MTTSIRKIMMKMEQTLSHNKLASTHCTQRITSRGATGSLQNTYWNYSISRTRDEITTKVVNNLFRKFKNARELAKADIEEIKAIIHSIGFYNIKAKRIKDVSQLIVERFNGEVPDDIQKFSNYQVSEGRQQTVF